jgi:[ribosomal protein S5]-alanine N-acetyltransferase
MRGLGIQARGATQLMTGQHGARRYQEPRSGGDPGSLGGDHDGAAVKESARREQVIASGERVYLRRPQPSDEAEFVALMQASRAFHRPWASAPTNRERFGAYLADATRSDFEAMLVCRTEDDAILGFFNLSHITRGALQSGYLGYAVGKRFAGQGYMSDGLELVLRHAFLRLGLHRIEANIQPGNRASIALARGAGFRREGFSRRYLKIGGRWRDHERWAIIVDDWRTRSRGR